MVIHTITHKHANIYLIGEGGRFVLFDCGWQDSFPFIKAALRGYGVGFKQVCGVFVSHFHPDHAGSLELLHRHGVPPLILERQMPYIAWLNEFFTQKKNDARSCYVPIEITAISPITPDGARNHLSDYGIDGKILYSPGHSDDSITLIAGETAFIGDLPPYETAENYGSSLITECWRDITACGVKRIYPAHGAMTEMMGKTGKNIGIRQAFNSKMRFLMTVLH